MEFIVASAIGLLTSAGIYLVLRLRTFPVIMGISLLTYAVNVFLFASGRLTVGAPPILRDGVSIIYRSVATGACSDGDRDFLWHDSRHRHDRTWSLSGVQ